MGGADQQAGPRPPRCRQEFINIGLSIGYGDDLCALRNQFLSGIKGRQPALTLFILSLKSLPLMLFTSSLWVPHPDLLVKQSQWNALDGCQQNRMQFQSLPSRMVQVSQPFGCPMARKIQAGCILNGQYPLASLKTLQRALDVTLFNGIGIHPTGSPKAVCALSGSPASAGSRYASRWLGRQALNLSDQAFVPALLAQIHMSQFVSHPASLRIPHHHLPPVFPEGRLPNSSLSDKELQRPQKKHYG